MWLDISTTSSGSLHLFQLPPFLFSFFFFSSLVLSSIMQPDNAALFALFTFH